VEMFWEMFYAKEEQRDKEYAEWKERNRVEKAEYERKQAEADKKRELEKAEYEHKQAEADKKRELEKAEFDKKWAETMAAWEKADRRIEAGNKKLGALENTFGEIVEHLVSPGIEERFRELGLDFELQAKNLRLKEGRNYLAEIDLLLENGENIMAVEVKSKPHVNDMERHAERLARLRNYYGKLGDRRRILGAIAGAVFGIEEKQAALEAGFYVIVQSGDTMQMDIPEGFEPKVW